jgi:hypothetical protein
MMDTKEMELILLRNLYVSAKRVASWDYEDFDPEPKRDMDDFKKEVARIKNLLELMESAESSARAAGMANMAQGRY